MSDVIGTMKSSERAATAVGAGESELAVRCLLMPFQGFNLLIPNTAVAEVIGYEAPRSLEQTPAWLRGFIAWRGRNVPVVSLETLLGLSEGVPSSHSRVIIFNALGAGKTLPFLAMIAQGIPRLHALKEENLHYAPGERKQETGVLVRLLVDGNPVVVPDLEQLEKMLNQIGVRDGK